MKNISNLLSKVKKAFKNKEYRHAYVDEFLNVSIATQIKVLREQNNWGQEELAIEVGMKQPRISVMENVNYSSWSINTLRKLAKAFDLTLRVSFESFGDRIKEIDQFNLEALERLSFEKDPAFVEKEEVKINAATKALPDAQEKESPEVQKALLLVVSAVSAGASQGKGKSQGEDVVSKQRGAIGIGEHLRWGTPKRATA